MNFELRTIDASEFNLTKLRSRKYSKLYELLENLEVNDYKELTFATKVDALKAHATMRRYIRDLEVLVKMHLKENIIKIVRLPVNPNEL